MKYLFTALIFLSSVNLLAEDDSDSKNAFQADQVARLIQLEEIVRTLQGRVDELEFRLSGRKIDKPTMVQPQPAFSTPPVISNSQATTLSGAPSVVPMDLLNEDKAYAPGYDPEVAESFSRALNFLEKGITNSAFTEINAAIDLNLSKKETSRLMFWKGIIYEALGDNNKAIKTYAEIAAKYPLEIRTRTALLRQGSAFILVNEKELAKITFDKLIADYPGSEEAKKASARKADLR